VIFVVKCLRFGDSSLFPVAKLSYSVFPVYSHLCASVSLWFCSVAIGLIVGLASHRGERDTETKNYFTTHIK